MKETVMSQDELKWHLEKIEAIRLNLIAMLDEEQ